MARPQPGYAPKRFHMINPNPSTARTELQDLQQDNSRGVVRQSASHSQRTRILHLLQATWPGWVPATALAKISLQYNSRVLDLRRAGWTITNRVATLNGQKHGSFLLGPPETPRSAELRAQVRVGPKIDRKDALEARPAAATLHSTTVHGSQTEATPGATANSFPEFGSLGPERRYPD
jgi:hypothetical protein